MGSEIDIFKELSLCVKSTNDLSLSEVMEGKKHERQNKSIDVQLNDHDHQHEKDNPKCNKCPMYLAYCEKLSQNLAEIEESSKYLMSNCTSLKEQLEESKKSEETCLKIYSDLESKYRDMGRELASNKQKCEELQAELITMKSIMGNTLAIQQQQQQAMTTSDISLSIVYNDAQKSPVKSKPKSQGLEKSIQTVANTYIPSSLKALMYAQQMADAQKGIV